MHYQEIISKILSKRFVRGEHLRIQCDHSRAIAYKDVLELYLRLSKVKQWEWQDVHGNKVPRQSSLTNIASLFRDFIAWPFIYKKQSSVIRHLFAVQRGADLRQGNSSVLFLRTDHWFNIKSGGSAGHLSGIIHGLRSWGLTTHVVSTDRLAGVDHDEYFHLCEPRYELGRNIPNIPELLYNDQIKAYIDEQWSTWSPSLLYQRYSLGNYVGALLKSYYHIPFVCEYNGSFPWVARHWENRKLFHEKLLADIELLNLHAADVIVVVSQPLKDELAGRGIQEERILVNPNGVDSERYSPDIDGSDVRRKYNMNSKTVIGFIGTFGRWHGAEVLAEAFGRLLKEHPHYRTSVRLLMIGDGMTMPLVKEALAKHAVADACILTGRVPQEQGPAHLAACDIFASPHVPNPDGTPFFGSPTKLFEYMAMGKGIVASDLDQIGEILEHNRTAWMVKPGDAKSLMHGLKTLIDDRQLRDRLGEAARAEVIEKYTWKEHTRKIIDALRELTLGAADASSIP